MVWETEHSVFYAFDLPGVTEDRIAVEVEDGALTVSAPIGSATWRQWASVSSAWNAATVFSPGRSDYLSAAPKDSIGASYTNGVLEIRVPKPEQPKLKRISVGGSSGSLPTIESKGAGTN